MRDSILFSSIRSFCVAFFSVIGILVAFTLMILLIALISEETPMDVQSNFTAEIAPNAQNIRKALSKDAPVILKVNVEGVIGLDSLTTQTFRQQLIESREGTFKDNRVKAVLVYMNSPGGTVTDADGIYRALKSYKEQYKVPVYVYVDGLCASGGMYIAAAADKVYASDVSIIGSIGVLSPSFFNVTKLMDKVGVDALTLTAGKGKDELNPFRPWKAGEQDNMQHLIDYYYDYFVHIMTSNRPEINKEKLVADYGAKIFPASQALEYGYIDGSGYSLNDTLKLLAKQVGIEDDYYQVYQLEKKTWYSTLFSASSALTHGKIKHQIELAPEFNPELMNQFLYLYKP
jgi:protease IV